MRRKNIEKLLAKFFKIWWFNVTNVPLILDAFKLYLNDNDLEIVEKKHGKH